MDIIKTETDMINRGRELGKTLSAPTTIELIGDVGTGKTTLVKGIARGLGITTPITSPSFTLSKLYKSGACKDQKDVIILHHYDFYRLADPGIMAEELAESIHDPNTITIVEWAETVRGVLPKKRTKVTLKYLDDGSRSVEIAQ